MEISHSALVGGTPPWGNTNLVIHNPNPDKIAARERPVAQPAVHGDGSGTCQVLDSLKTGDREDLFNKIEEAFKHYVPEVEKLSLITLSESKQIQVREHGLKRPLPATELSEGTRIILCLLTILHQENPPPIILLEDIDRGLHPRLFEYMAPLIRRIAEDHDINVIATTHNPYLVNYFRDDKEAVVLVEKENGESKLIPLTDRINDLHDSNGDVDEVPLGDLWFSGLLGGVPKSINLRARAGA
jgi:predicted ATPase